MRRWPFFLIVAFSLGGLCGPGGFTPPPPDSCGTPVSYAAGALELGVGDDDHFTLLHDGDVVQTVTGGQGFQMIPLRLHLIGATPGCITQDTEVTSSDRGSIVHDTSPLKTYGQPDGSFLTRADYLIVGFGQPGEVITIAVMTGGVTTSLRVFLNQPGDLGATD
jgi:hypothetical protein